MSNIFTQLLTTIGEADRAILSGIAERNPGLNDYLADPAGVRKVQEVRDWYAGNWDAEHNCTREEHARKIRIDALEAELAARPQGEEMNLAELNAFLDGKIANGEVVSSKLMKDELGNLVAQKDAEFNNRFNALGAASMDAMYLSSRHLHEHNEVLDTVDLLNKATEAKATNLRDFYESAYAKDKIEAKRATATAEAKAKYDAELAAAREEGRKAALTERVGQDGQMPTIEGAPSLGHFQMRVQQPKTDADGKAIPANTEIGRGLISRLAAAEADRREMSGVTQ